jgi:hypothetical protein
MLICYGEKEQWSIRDKRILNEKLNKLSAKIKNLESFINDSGLMIGSKQKLLAKLKTEANNIQIKKP